DIDVLVDVEGRRLRGVQDLDRVRLHLDLAGVHLRVDGAFRAFPDDTFHANDVLIAKVAGSFVGILLDLGVEDDLGDAESIAEVDEDQPAEVPAPIDPPPERHVLARVVDAERPTGDAVNGIWSDVEAVHVVSLVFAGYKV